jgi:hypothetical protein
VTENIHIRKRKMICINVLCRQKKYDLMFQLMIQLETSKIARKLGIWLLNLKSATAGFGTSKIITLEPLELECLFPKA